MNLQTQLSIPAPANIAREALRRLGLERRPPTPENFREFYDEISGQTTGASEEAENYKLRVAADAIAGDPDTSEICALLSDAINERTWPRARAALIALARTRRRERPVGGADREAVAAEAATSGPAWREHLLCVLDAPFLSRLSEEGDLKAQAVALAASLRARNDGFAPPALAAELRELLDGFDARGAQMLELREGAVQLARLIAEGVGDMVLEDTWLKQQMEVVTALLARPPSRAMLEDVAQVFRELRRRQFALRGGLQEARSTQKGLAQNLLGQLDAVTAEAGEYGRRMQQRGERIRDSEPGMDSNRELVALLDDSRALRIRAAAAQQDVATARAASQNAEERIRMLEQQLHAATEQVRKDFLTGALNRRGFGEAFEVETSRARREDTRLCVSLIDVDNFKQMNDRYGHQAGDAALMHLTQAVKDALRPTDVVARYGGEEFLVLLPNTMLAAAEAVMVRVQRELTKRLFLNNNERILITFSAGVAEWLPPEDEAVLIARADAAMYIAKKTGKNKVVAAATP